MVCENRTALGAIPRLTILCQTAPAEVEPMLFGILKIQEGRLYLPSCILVIKIIIY